MWEVKKTKAMYCTIFKFIMEAQVQTSMEATMLLKCLNIKKIFKTVR